MTVHLRPPTFDSPLVGSALGADGLGGVTNQHRESALGWSTTMTSGQLALSYFRVPVTFTAANMAYYSSTVAAAATPTLVKFALFSVAANGDLTRIAVTASDTAIFASVNTRYTRALLASVQLVPGVTYASGILLTTGAAAPTLVSPITVASTSAPMAAAPKLCAVVVSQTDISASYATAGIANSSSRFFAEITT